MRSRGDQRRRDVRGAGLAGVLAVLLGVLLVARSMPAHALEVEVTRQAVAREILALYDSRREKVPHETRLHKFAEMPLNYLGYALVFHDVNKPLPALADLARYKAVLTWFIEPLANPKAVASWLDQATAQGLRYIVLGDLVPPSPSAALPEILHLHERLGLTYTGEYVDVTLKSKPVQLDPMVIGFERPLDRVLPDFPVATARSEKTTVHLGIETATRDGLKTAAVVATGPGGGFAAQNFTIYYEPITDRVVWVLNPFAFFRAALGRERMPAPDTTTRSGRRIYFSHIDGDGWNNLTELERYRTQEMLSAEVIAREAIEPYPDLPVSVALIAGDVVSELGGSRIGAQVARRLFKLPQVEVASHTYTHPYNWQFFERYDRAAEEALIDQYQRPQTPWRERITETLRNVAGKEQRRTASDRYIAGTDDLPRTFLKLPFDLEKEMLGALKVSEGHAPEGKKAKIYQWSGDTTPFEGAIKVLRLSGIANINGGDSRLDREYPSIAYVPPISRLAGDERQIYAANSNENTYTNDWTGPYYGFFLLEETLANTETPRRLKPFNLYYHMYSGEKPAALAAVKHFLNTARASDVIPVAASTYAAIADSYFKTTIEQLDALSWAVSRRGEMQTVRFDDADELELDLARSTGAIGANRHAGSLYVALDAAVEQAVVTLQPRAGAGAVPSGEAPLSLVHARWSLRGFEASGCGATMTAEGFGPGQMVWRAKPGRLFTITALRDGQTLVSDTARADPSGLLTFSLEADAIAPLTLRMTCDG